MTSESEGPEAQLAAYAAELAEGINQVLPGWTVRCVVARFEQWSGPVSDELRRSAETAGLEARLEVGSAVTALLALDIDEQRVPPLSLLRGAVRYPTAVLVDAGVPGVIRDDFAERNFPDDIYDLTPASFGDVDPGLHEPGLVWGAAKAHVHLVRRRAEGQR